MKKKDLTNKYSENPELVGVAIDILAFLKVFDTACVQTRMLMVNNLIRLLTSFNNINQKERFVEATEKWYRDEREKRPFSDKLPRYEAFCNAIKTFSLMAENPREATLVSDCIKDMKGILEQKIEKLSKR